jgi:hypothetical protein
MTMAPYEEQLTEMLDYGFLRAPLMPVSHELIANFVFVLLLCSRTPHLRMHEVIRQISLVDGDCLLCGYAQVKFLPLTVDPEGRDWPVLWDFLPVE